MTLFDPGEPVEELSAGQRLTIRNRNSIERGIHPATGQPIIYVGATCAGCERLQRRGRSTRTFFKCERHRFGITGGAGTDVRASWPACALWTPGAGNE